MGKKKSKGKFKNIIFIFLNINQSSKKYFILKFKFTIYFVIFTPIIIGILISNIYFYFFLLVCCIYNKPHCLDSSSSSDEEDCHHDGSGGAGHNRYDRLPKHQRRAMREKTRKENEDKIPDSQND